MHLPPHIVPFFSDSSQSVFASILPELLTSGCKMWVDKETLMGREATFLVFLRGAAGQPSNACMNSALDHLSIKMRQLIPQLVSTQFGSIGSNRVNTPPNTNVTPMKTPSAWGSNSSFGPGAVGVGSGPGGPGGVPDINGSGSVGGVGGAGGVEEEDHSTESDEYYDPEDLARSLSLLGEETDSEWCTVPAKRSVASTRRPEPLKLSDGSGGSVSGYGGSGGSGGGYVQRWLEIPRDSVGLVIGQGGKKIKDLCTLSGAKIQFRVNKTAEREGRPGLLELQGGIENVDQGLQLVWDLLHLLGKEYQEVPVQRVK